MRRRTLMGASLLREASPTLPINRQMDSALTNQIHLFLNHLSHSRLKSGKLEMRQSNDNSNSTNSNSNSSNNNSSSNSSGVKGRVGVPLLKWTLPCYLLSSWWGWTQGQYTNTV